MVFASRRSMPALAALVLVFSALTAFADNWTKPTAEELQMTSDPSAPGAAALCLLRDENADDKLHVHITYIRLKILTEKGKQYADQEISYNSKQFKIFGVEGRTIHSDGTVIPFTGKPYVKFLERSGTEKSKATVFTLPDVQVGSILEFRYVLSYDSNIMYAPQWYLQGPFFVRKAHFQFVPSDRRLENGHGGSLQGRYAYATYLPPGGKVVYSPAGKYYTIDVADMPALAQEEFMPPMHNYSYRALFYYTIARTADEYWASEGKYWSKNADKFIAAGKLTPVVDQLVSPADTPVQKLQKLYNAVMKMDNSSFNREYSDAENKAEGFRDKTAFDIWQQKRGNRDDLTRLFVGLARAAGFKAYVGIVTNRDRSLFVPDYFEMSQLDDEVAIVEVNGTEKFFDPGERYAAFGELHWKHSASGGIRQTAQGTVIFNTPVPAYQSTSETREADLEMEPDGTVHGQIRIVLTGSRALYWRQFALKNDEAAFREDFEKTVQGDMPPGIEVKADHFLALTDWESNLHCVLKVSGSMGTASAKRVFVPATLFANTSHPLFSLDKRTMPVDLKYPYIMQDVVSIKLPPALAIESLPKDTEFSFPQMAIFRAKFAHESDYLKSTRLIALGNAVFRVEEYPQLKDFYQKINAKDKEPAVLGFVQAASLGSADGKSK